MENNFVQEYLNSISASGQTKTSIKTLQKCLSQETVQLAERLSFIPFLKERDGMNKILTTNPANETVHNLRVSDNFYSVSSPKLCLRKKVSSIQIVPIYPAVGSYNLRSDWVKRSFSSKNTNFVSTKPQKPATKDSNNRLKAEKEEKKPIAEKKYKKPENRFEHVIERKEFRNFVQRPLGTWNSLKVHGTPKGIKEELEFNQELIAIKKYQVEIKSFLNELKR